MPEHVDLARRMMGAIGEVRLEEAIRICDPEIELTTLLDLPGEPPFRGHDGLREWFARIAETWAFIEIRDSQLEHHGDWVLGFGSGRVRGRASPNEVELEWAAAGKIAGGRFVKFGIYLNRERALAEIAAG